MPTTTTTTKKERIEAYANRKIREHLPLSWVFKWDHAKLRLGCCNYRKQTISLSRHHIEGQTVEQMQETIMHEIAHALTPGNGHGKLWQRKMRQFGLKPEVTGKSTVSPPHSWEIVDPTDNNAVVAKYYRKPRTDLHSLYRKGRKSRPSASWNSAKSHKPTNPKHPPGCRHSVATMA